MTILSLPDRELFLAAVQASTNATLKIVILVLLGVIATTQGVFNERGISDLGRLVYYISLPSLVFTNILTEVTWSRLMVLWKLPATAVVHVTCAFFLSKLLNKALRIKGIEARAVSLSLMFGNVGSLSIAVIGTLCADEPLVSMVGPTCNVKGVEYISFYLIAQNIMIFTWAEHIVKQQYEADEAQEELEAGEPQTQAIEAPSKSALISAAQDSGTTPAANSTDLPPAVDITVKKQASPPHPVHRLTHSASQIQVPHGHLGGPRLQRSQSSMSMDDYTLHSIMSRYPMDTLVAPPAADENADRALQRVESWVRRPSFANINDLSNHSPRSRSGSAGNIASMLPSVDEHVASAPSEKDQLMPTPTESARSTRPVYLLLWDLVYNTWLVVYKLLSNPTVRAATLAFILGVIPPVKALFVGGSNPPLGSVLQAIQILGQAQVPCSMLMLSGSGTIRYMNYAGVADKQQQDGFHFSPAAVTAIILGRVVIFPIIGLLIWWAMLEAGMMQGLPIASLVLLLDAAVPTAQNMVLLFLVHGKPEHGHALAYVVLWQYALSVPFLILYCAVYLALIKDVFG